MCWGLQLGETQTWVASRSYSPGAGEGSEGAMRDQGSGLLPELRACSQDGATSHLTLVWVKILFPHLDRRKS